METLALHAVVLDDDTGAPDDLAGVALTVDLAETSPGTEDLGVTDLDQVDLVLRAECLNQLDVLGLRARLDEDAQVGLTLVQRLSTLAKTASKTVVDEGVLQNLLRILSSQSPLTSEEIATHLKRILNRQLALGSLRRHLDLSHGSLDLNFISSVRHPK